jgi:hypothetical protein
MMAVLEMLMDVLKFSYPFISIPFQLFQRLYVDIYRELWKHVATENSIPEELYDLNSLCMRPEPRQGPNQANGSALN